MKTFEEYVREQLVLAKQDDAPHFRSIDKVERAILNLEAGIELTLSQASILEAAFSDYFIDVAFESMLAKVL